MARGKVPSALASEQVKTLAVGSPTWPVARRSTSATQGKCSHAGAPTPASVQCATLRIVACSSRARSQSTWFLLSYKLNTIGKRYLDILSLAGSAWSRNNRKILGQVGPRQPYKCPERTRSSRVVEEVRDRQACHGLMVNFPSISGGPGGVILRLLLR
jgi:hypothetical protein